MGSIETSITAWLHGLWNAIAMQVPIAHGHQRTRVATSWSGIEVQDRQSLVFFQMVSWEIFRNEQKCDVISTVTYDN